MGVQRRITRKQTIVAQAGVGDRFEDDQDDDEIVPWGEDLHDEFDLELLKDLNTDEIEVNKELPRREKKVRVVSELDSSFRVKEKGEKSTLKVKEKMEKELSNTRLKEPERETSTKPKEKVDLSTATRPKEREKENEKEEKLTDTQKVLTVIRNQTPTQSQESKKEEEKLPKSAT